MDVRSARVVAFLLALAAGTANAQSPVPRGLVERRWGQATATRCVPDVGAALSLLPDSGEPLGFDPGVEGSFFSVFSHWQGLQRLAVGDGRWLVATRSGPGAAFVIVRMGSRDASGGPFRATRLYRGQPARHAAPPPMDRVILSVPAEPGLGHAGGPQVAGHVLVVPLEARGDSSAVAFHDLGDPSAPRRLLTFRRPSGGDPTIAGHASLAALARLDDHRWLLVIGARSSKSLSFFVSVDTTVVGLAGFQPLEVVGDEVVGGFQNLNLVTQCDGELFLAGMHNTGFPPPSLGHDHLHWYALEARQGRLGLVERGERGFTCRECNFSAGAGLYVTPAGGMLLYGIGRGLGGPGGTAQVEEFAPPAPD
jgi:hypothetical protein